MGISLKGSYDVRAWLDTAVHASTLVFLLLKEILKCMDACTSTLTVWRVVLLCFTCMFDSYALKVI